MYEIKFTNKAAKYLKKIKDRELKLKFKEKIEKIAENPYIGTMKVGDLDGIYGYDVIDKGNNYELAYTIHEIDNKQVVILLAGTRENFYEELKRYTNTIHRGK